MHLLLLLPKTPVIDSDLPLGELLFLKVSRFFCSEVEKLMLLLLLFKANNYHSAF